ncbi:MAG TPA: VOC family protein [Candidatus Cybelea sp.]|nr:VOC family protein [Candidatus Cybelea sp.]
MNKPDGVHHLAITTADIKTQIAYFSDVLGMELVALYWMHGVQGAWHGFMKLNDHSSIAFVQTPDIPKIARQIGVTHAGNPGAPCAGGAMQHLALNARDETELMTLRDRIRSRGINVFGPIDHGFCKSIYFAGPENLSLEISTSRAAIDSRAWIDPEVVRLAGISETELARYKSPQRYEGKGGTVPQPPYDPARPHMVYPERRYKEMLATPDAEYTRQRSETTPPVKVA